MQRYDVERAARSGRNPPDPYGELDEEQRSGQFRDRGDERYAGDGDYPQYAEGYQRYPGDFQRGAYRRDPPDTGHGAWHQQEPSPRRGAWHQYDEEPAETSWHRGERDRDEANPYSSPAYGSPRLSEQRIAHYGYGDEFRRYGRDMLSAGRGDTRDLRHHAGWHSAAQHERYDSSRYGGRRYEAAGPYTQAGAHAYGREDDAVIDAYGGSVGDFDELPLRRDAHSSSRDLYDSASSANRRGRGPKNYARSDERIREDVSEHLADDETIDAGDITVEVSDGVVTLSGSVDTRRLKHRAEDIADCCSGVKDVQNRLTVKAHGAPEADSLLGQGAQAQTPGAAGSSATDTNSASTGKSDKT